MGAATLKSKVIGLYSPLPQSGKSTVREMILDEYEATPGALSLSWPFATTLKAMLAYMLTDVGYQTETVERMLYGDMKGVSLDLLGGQSPRDMMISLGTAWGRDRVCSDLWIKTWLGRVRCDHEMGFTVVADDVRFPNEVAAVRQLGGEVWLVERPNDVYEPDPDNPTEGNLDDLDFDHRIVNSFGADGLDDTREQVRRALV